MPATHVCPPAMYGMTGRSSNHHGQTSQEDTCDVYVPIGYSKARDNDCRI